ncbi:hypothetical protein B0H21DRAFT_710287 [Amylocystis lapponica]|nr:hypothetical protein B0H21DRAFT_710287 [Amylocystis lapponica]
MTKGADGDQGGRGMGQMGTRAGRGMGTDNGAGMNESERARAREWRQMRVCECASSDRVNTVAGVAEGRQRQVIQRGVVDKRGGPAGTDMSAGGKKGGWPLAEQDLDGCNGSHEASGRMADEIANGADRLRELCFDLFVVILGKLDPEGTALLSNVFLQLYSSELTDLKRDARMSEGGLMAGSGELAMMLVRADESTWTYEKARANEGAWMNENEGTDTVAGARAGTRACMDEGEGPSNLNEPESTHVAGMEADVGAGSDEGVGDDTDEGDGPTATAKETERTRATVRSDMMVASPEFSSSAGGFIPESPKWGLTMVKQGLGGPPIMLVND